MGATFLHVELNGKKLLHAKINFFDMKFLQKVAIDEYGKPNRIKYRSKSNRVLEYDNMNIHIVFDDTVGAY